MDLLRAFFYFLDPPAFYCSCSSQKDLIVLRSCSPSSSTFNSSNHPFRTLRIVNMTPKKNIWKTIATQLLLLAKHRIVSTYLVRLKNYNTEPTAKINVVINNCLLIAKPGTKWSSCSWVRWLSLDFNTRCIQVFVCRDLPSRATRGTVMNSSGLPSKSHLSDATHNGALVVFVNP